MAVCEIECSRCNKVHSYDCENLEWECVGSEERQMGRENEYNATIEDTCSCEQNMTVTFKCWEYPVGIENTTDIEVNGATIIKNECASCPNLQEQPD